MSLFTLAAGAASLAGLTYLSGLFDRPEYVYQETIPKTSSAEDGELFAVVALSRNKNISKEIPRMLFGMDRVMSSPTCGAIVKARAEAANTYCGDEEIDKISVGFYLDNPTVEDHPRWGIGWLVKAMTMEEARALAQQTSTRLATSEERVPERIVAVRMHKGPVLTARILWRNYFTPMIAPMLHWGRAMKAYKAGGYSSSSGSSKYCKSDTSIACEIYVHSSAWFKSFIDYHLLIGDTTNIFDDIGLPLVEAVGEGLVTEET